MAVSKSIDTNSYSRLHHQFYCVFPVQYVNTNIYINVVVIVSVKGWSVDRQIDRKIMKYKHTK